MVFFISEDSRFHHYHSLLTYRTSFSISCKAELLVTNFLRFPHLQCLYFTFVSVDTLAWECFSVSILNVLFQCLLLSIIFNEKFAVIQIIVKVYRYVSSCSCSQDFKNCILSWFSILITMSPNRFSFDFILKDKLETKWTFWICKSLPLSEILDNYLLIFSGSSFFSLPSGIPITYLLSVFPTFTKLWYSLKYLFFSVFQIQYFLCSVFKFSDSSVTCRPPVT